jgi:hypothetical protein
MPDRGEHAALDNAALIREVAPYTKSSPQRIAAMAGAVRRIDRDSIAGDIAECGVWRGGNIILARKLSPERMCWLYDTFFGMTEPQDVDVTRSGKKASESYRRKMLAGGKWAGVSVADVRANLAATGTLDDARLRFVEGPVERTLLDPANLPAAISVLRLNTDWYESTRVELEILYPLLAPGGVLIVDDYGHWRGARKAVDAYFGREAARLQPIDYTAVMMVK